MNASQRPVWDRVSGRRYGWHGAILSGGDDGVLSSRRADMPQGDGQGRANGGRPGRTLRSARGGPGGSRTRRSRRRTAARRACCTRTCPGPATPTAFIRVKAAYDVLGDAERRAAYDRSARAGRGSRANRPIEEPPRGPRLSDLPVALWVGLGGSSAWPRIMAVLRAQPSPQPPQGPVIRPFAPSVPAVGRCRRAQATAAANGPTTHYVLPAGDDTVLWRHDAARDAFLPAGRVAAFSPVRALRLVPQHGLVEISLADGGTGFIDAARLTPGDRATAQRAYCAYNAGDRRRGTARCSAGTAMARRVSRSATVASQPAVVKLRDASGQAAATVFVAPGDSGDRGEPAGHRLSPRLRHRRAVEPRLQRLCRRHAGAAVRRLRLALRAVAAGDPARPFRRLRRRWIFPTRRSNTTRDPDGDHAAGVVARPVLCAVLRGAGARCLRGRGRRRAVRQFAASGRCGAQRDGRHGRCLLGRADARHAGLSADPRLRPGQLRRGGDARSVPAGRPRAAS